MFFLCDLFPYNLLVWWFVPILEIVAFSGYLPALIDEITFNQCSPVPVIKTQAKSKTIMFFSLLLSLHHRCNSTLVKY